MRSRSIFMLTTILLGVISLSPFSGNPNDTSTYLAVVPNKALGLKWTILPLPVE